MERCVKSVLIVRGAFGDVYEPAWYRALNELGVSCELFDAHKQTLPGIWGRVERRILCGPGVSKIRRLTEKLVRETHPEVTLLYQGHYHDRESINSLRKLSTIVGYHNDDPFGIKKSILRYRHLIPALPFYHGYHFYRQRNVEESKIYGVRNASLLMPYFIPWLDFPRTLTAEESSRFGCDVVYIGHAEPDDRGKCFAEARRAGLHVKVWGDPKYWKNELPREMFDTKERMSPLFGEDYRKAICAAKIAACFFSNWNRDEYTRRSFEIPACGIMLLSKRTPAMLNLFTEDKEAVYFSSVEEFVDKAKFYSANDTARIQIAKNGYERVLKSDYDIYSRMKQWLRSVSVWR
jgi:hypothetical protein